MLADRRHYWIAPALLFTTTALLVSSTAVAQQQPPSGAVRSHYALPNATATAPANAPVVNQQSPPVYVPVTPVNSAVVPATHLSNLQEPAPFPERAATAPPIPLSPRGTSSGKALIRTPASGWGAVSSVGASLGLVLAAFLCVAWLSKRYLPKAAGPLPKEVVEQLGWTPLTGRQQMQLVRLGNKLLLIAVTPGNSAEPLGEVTDAAEVERLSAICRRTKPDSSTHTFREVISELERQPARGFVESPAQARPARPANPLSVSTTAQPRPTVARPLHG